jgi:hypothetical protein
LATLISVSLLSGWDFHLLPLASEMTGFVSHDEFLHLYTDKKDLADSAKDDLDRAGIGGKVKTSDAADDSPGI